jgi:orotidine-5'-phosphate decarboxylase
MTNPVFCALDTNSVADACNLASQIKPHIGGLKVGLEFFLANGAAGYHQVAALGLPMFLDVKLHDIPNTVAGGIRSLLLLKPQFITIHASGGPAMLEAAARAAAEAGATRPKILAVTVLTSMNDADLAAVGQDPASERQVVRLAALTRDCGVDGVICSPAEIAPIRQAVAKDFILMVPGIRPAWAASNDQKRVLTPHEAMQAGASHLVIGRPITAAANPAEAAQHIAAELAA